MSLTRTLLAGASVLALCATPVLALAAPHIHLVGSDNVARMKAGSVHIKTGKVHEDITDLTETLTFSAALPQMNKKTLLWSETWQDTNSCRPPAHEKLELPKRSKHAKLRVGTSTGPTSACPNSTFTMYGPVYDLQEKATSDAFSATLAAFHYSGYHLVLNVNTTLF